MKDLKNLSDSGYMTCLHMGTSKFSTKVWQRIGHKKKDTWNQNVYKKKTTCFFFHFATNIFFT